MKKLVTMVLAVLMVLSLAITAGAEGEAYPYMSNITVKGLAAGDETTINLFQIIRLDETENNWVVADWAAEYVTLADGEYTISDDVVEAPVEHVYATRDTNEITEVFNVPVGAYVVVASGNKATYTKMIANTYDAEALYMAAKDVTVVAKTAGYEVTKEANDHFVARGQEVVFTVGTIYPSFEKNATNKTYKLIDTSDDLAIQSVGYVKIGGEEVSDYTAAYNSENAAEYVIDLTNTIGENNENAGKTVEVQYTAIVLTEGGYENTVNAFRGEEAMDKEPPVVNGYTGDITITKYDEADGETILNGAEFTVAKQIGEDEEGNPVYGEELAFVELETGVYKLAKEDDETSDTKIVATEGTVQVKGLDEGTYHFTETKAPKGYSVNEDGVTVTVEANDEAHVSVEDEILDTKLIALPETGGVGTLIFTVCGGAIMIAAAFLFFANRKNKED